MKFSLGDESISQSHQQGASEMSSSSLSGTESFQFWNEFKKKKSVKLTWRYCEVGVSLSSLKTDCPTGEQPELCTDCSHTDDEDDMINASSLTILFTVSVMCG